MAVALQPAVFALQGASNHSAAVFRQALCSMQKFTGVVDPSDYAVTAQSTPNMSVQVSAGQGWIYGTQQANATGAPWNTQQAYFVLNDAPVSVTVSAADPTNPRIDVVYVAVQDAFYSGGANGPVLGIVTGTPAATPAVPALPANAMGLAQVAVAANATAITSGNITTLIGANATRLTVLGQRIACNSTSRPATTYLWAGQEILELDTGREYYWSGSAWVYTGGGSNPNAWVDVSGSLGAGFTAGSDGCRYKVVGNAVYFQFHIVRSTGTTTGTVYTFPSGLRPTYNHWWVAETGGNPVGEIKLTGASGALAFTFSASASTVGVVSGTFPIG